MKISVALTVACLVVAATSTSGAGTERPRIEVPFSKVEPSMDLTKEDAVWQTATTINELTAPSDRVLPPGAPRTKIRLLWTKADLWIRFESEAATVTRLPAGSTERDQPYFLADCVEVFIDPVGDGQSFVELQVSPDNGVFDGLHLFTTRVESGADLTVKSEIIRRDAWFFSEWNLVGLRTAARQHLTAPDGGWTAVLAIPAKALLHRLAVDEFSAGLILRANFLRFDYSTRPGAPAIISNWAPVVGGRAHRSPAGMGYLTLIRKADAPQ